MKFASVLFLVTVIAIQAKPVAKFESLSGNVQYKGKDGKWLPAKLGQGLAAETVVETGPRGKAVLVFANGSELTLNSLTQVTLDLYSIGKFGTQTVMSLRTGRVVARIAKYKNANELNYFMVRTPTAVAGVRGTIKEVAYTPDKGSEIKLLESGAEILNAAHQKSAVPEGGKSRVSESATETADKVATREANALMNSHATTSEGEVTVSQQSGDYNFSPNLRDNFEMLHFFDKSREDNFRDLLRKPGTPGGATAEDTLAVEKL